MDVPIRTDSLWIYNGPRRKPDRKVRMAVAPRSKSSTAQNAHVDKGVRGHSIYARRHIDRVLSNPANLKMCEKVADSRMAQYGQIRFTIILIQ